MPKKQPESITVLIIRIMSQCQHNNQVDESELIYHHDLM